MATTARQLAAANISIRIRVEQRDLIDRAAERLGRTRSDFMLDVACREAENVLLDQTFFQADTHSFRQFQDLLDNPPEPSVGLLNLMKAATPWDQ
jgi:uncharacterized protein (DUF1778 family)